MLELFLQQEKAPPPTRPPPPCPFTGKPFNLFRPQFPALQNGHSDGVRFTALLGVVNTLVCDKHLEEPQHQQALQRVC